MLKAMTTDDASSKTMTVVNSTTSTAVSGELVRRMVDAAFPHKSRARRAIDAMATRLFLASSIPVSPAAVTRTVTIRFWLNNASDGIARITSGDRSTC